MADAKQVMELRGRTGAGMVDCKVALEEANGDMEKAIEILRKKGAAKAAKKSAERTASEGILATYLHHNRRLATIVEIQCETDFVARNEDFVNFANDMAMQVAAMNPEYVSPETVPAEEVEKQRTFFTEQMASENKPDDIKAKIVEGKINKWFADVCLTKQAFFKAEEKTIEQMLTELIAKTGEKVVISRFVRYEMTQGPKTC
ncbi:MAG: translation elongation factor Ts [Patescibacteria group bacterium]|nr:translation elongation factor Ts [Patescibacteria group bacterium]